MPTPKYSIDNLKQASGITQQGAAPATRAIPEPSEPDKPIAERLGAYLTRDEYQAMRSAYMADIDNLPSGPDTMGEWVERAVHTHARKTPLRRAHATDNLAEIPSTGEDGDRYAMKTWPVDAQVHLLIKDAQEQDKANGYPHTSVSRWTANAIRAAIAEARTRNGGTLPPPPSGRTPKNPRR